MQIFGFFESGPDEEKMVCLSTIPRYSWYGDFQILLAEESPFLVRAHLPRKKTKTGVGAISTGCVQVFKLQAKIFLRILAEYPEYQRFMTQRALERRAYFTQRLDETKTMDRLRKLAK